MKEDKVYDFVIIGSGIGGLECAYILASEGYKVVVLEKNHQIGGNLQVFSRDKSVFDTGVHYIGNLDEGECLHKFFNYFGLLDTLKWKRMDQDCFDLIRFDDGKEYKLAQGYPDFIKNLVHSFPEEENAIKLYCSKIQEVCDSFPMYKIENTEADQFLGREYNDLLFRDTADFIASLTKNKRLQDVLAGNNPLYAGVRDKTPLYIHALITDSFIKGAYRLKDGGSQIAIELTKSIRKMGGEVLKRKAVTTANYYENGLVKEVITESGESFKGKNYISNAHPVTTLDIFGDEHFLKPYRKRIRSLENTISTFNVYISFKENTQEFLNYNIYKQTEDVWSGIDYNESNWGEKLFICTPPTSKSDTYADSMVIMSYMHYDEVKKWEDTTNTVAKPGARGQSYVDFKKEKEETILKSLEKVLPGIRSKIKSVYSATPLTLRDYIGDPAGALYGIQKDYKSPARSMINSNTKVSNLFLTGQNLILHGIVGVTIGAFVTCFNFVDKEKLISKINDMSKAGEEII